jgi:uncharacterized protein (DUF362 family)
MTTCGEENLDMVDDKCVSVCKEIQRVLMRANVLMRDKPMDKVSCKSCYCRQRAFAQKS